MSDELTPLQQLEREAALTGPNDIYSMDPIFQLITAVRRYRAAGKRLLAKRYADGECDAATLSEFSYDCYAIEQVDYSRFIDEKV